ncbi:uncharacterized protein [Arachis hypogaea]|uniref:uncharacterized protein n=1 Tax=Arachis hypogaea TaxID=3818 RepID=UPI003B2107B3
MAAKTKQKAQSQIQGAFREQYKRINHYYAELLRANPEELPTLQTLYQLGWVLLEDYSGWLVIDCNRKRPNDQILSIAYVVVEVETKDSWVWFLRHLSDDLGAKKIRRCTFMSDEQKSLLLAFEEVIPGVDNRCCMRHLYNNFRKKFPRLELKNQMWRCAKSTHWKDWEKEMKSLRLKNEGAYRHLNSIPPRFWSHSRFSFYSKCDSLVNNMSESFNALIVEARKNQL